jgi:hypothetical protein
MSKPARRPRHAAEERRAYWRERLIALKALVEGYLT